jgi:hypothetical protein
VSKDHFTGCRIWEFAVNRNARNRKNIEKMAFFISKDIQFSMVHKNIK